MRDRHLVLLKLSMPKLTFQTGLNLSLELKLSSCNHKHLLRRFVEEAELKSHQPG